MKKKNKILTYRVETLAKSNEFRAYQDILKSLFDPNDYITKETAQETIDNHLSRKVGN